MQEFILSGRVVDVILLLVAVEAVALTLLHRRRGRGIAPVALLPNLTAGVCLLLALRAALTGTAWPWTALWLAFAGLAHVLDLRARWRGDRR